MAAWWEQIERVWTEGSKAFQRLVDSVIRHESGGRVDAVSPVGARGLMQLMPDTAREIAGRTGAPGESRLVRDGDYNRQLGSAYLNKMLDRYAGSEVLALAAYNAGPGRVDQWLQRFGDPRTSQVAEADWVERIPFAETRNYTRSILRDIRQAGQLANASTRLEAAVSEPRGDGFNSAAAVVALPQHSAAGAGLSACPESATIPGRS